MGAWGTGNYVPSTPKMPRQGTSKNTKYSATSRNGAKRSTEDRVDNVPGTTRRFTYQR